MHNRLAFALLLATAAPVCAHVTLAVPNAPARSSYVGLFRVGHGCSGSPTTALTIEIPGAILSARPQPKPGWTISIAHTPVGAAGPAHVASVTWTGGPLPDDEFDEFAVMMRLPAKPGTLLFPAMQTCVKGSEQWHDTPMAGMTMPHPAPALTVLPAVPGQDNGMGGMHGM